MEIKLPTIQCYVDIETTATTNDAGIWEIGAILINNHNKSLYRFSELCIPDARFDQDTLNWISNQPEVHKRYLKAMQGEQTTTEALLKFTDWLKKCGVIKCRESEAFYSWGTFDFPILKHRYKHLLIAEPPWHYGSECDLRSVTKFLGLPNRPDTSKHIAREDASALLTCHSEIVNILNPEAPAISVESDYKVGKASY